MAELQFPNYPQALDTHIGINNVEYVFDGVKWIQKGGGRGGDGGAGVHLGPFPPSDPKTGDLWIDDNYYIYVFDGSWIEVGKNPDPYIPGYSQLP